MPSSSGRIAVALLLVCLCGFAQNRKVNSRNQHERIIAIVPFIGSGTMEDPKRPMFTPMPGSVAASSRMDIIAFHFIPSDDGNFAIVELIARDRAAFAAILSSTDSRVKVFERGQHPLAALVLEMRKVRKDFDLEKFGEVVVP